MLDQADNEHDSYHASSLVPLDGGGKLSLDELASDIRSAYLTCVKAREEWTKATLTLAERLYEARNRFGDNQGFSDWLAANSLGKETLSHQDRAALINIGEHIDVARDIIEKSDRRSWRLVWDKEIKKVVLREEVGVGPFYQSGNTAEAPEEDAPIDPVIEGEVVTRHEATSDMLHVVLDRVRKIDNWPTLSKGGQRRRRALAEKLELHLYELRCLERLAKKSKAKADGTVH